MTCAFRSSERLDFHWLQSARRFREVAEPRDYRMLSASHSSESALTLRVVLRYTNCELNHQHFLNR